MKIILAFLFAAQTFPHPDAPAPLPVFSFQEFVAGQTLTDKALRGCQRQPNGARFCTKAFSSIAGHRAIVVAEYYNNRLSTLVVSANRASYVDVLQAFSQKYGNPCGSKTDKWQSMGGTVLDNQVIDWCFESGKLQLKSIGSSLDEIAVEYSDQNSPPLPPAKVDF